MRGCQFDAQLLEQGALPNLINGDLAEVTNAKLFMSRYGWGLGNTVIHDASAAFLWGTSPVSKGIFPDPTQKCLLGA